MQSPHTQEAKDRIDDLVERLRESISEVDDARAEALIGLRTAIEHYERRSEEAWRRDGG